MSEKEQLNELMSIDLLRDKLINVALITLSILALPALASAVLEVKVQGWKYTGFAYIGAVLMLFILVFNRKRLSFRFKTWNIIIMLMMLAVLIMLKNGISSIGLIFFMTATILATILFEIKTAIAVLTLCIVSLIVLGGLTISGMVIIKIDFVRYNTSFLSWLSDVLAFVLFASMIIFTAGKTNETLVKSIKALNIRNSELEEAKNRAQIAHQAKNEFLSNISHEVRTPLNSIIVNADFLLNDLSDNRHSKLTKSIKTSSVSLLNLLNKILDLSAIETGQFKSNAEFVNVIECLNETIETCQVKAKRKGLDFKLEVIEPFPNSVYIDEMRLNTIVGSLLDNAIKFTKKGFVKVKLEAAKIEISDKSHIIISIFDTGKGISSDFLNSPFKDFSQESSGDNRSYEGAGIGLSLSSKIVEKLGGTLMVKSKVNDGTLITVSLPNIKSQYTEKTVANLSFTDDNDKTESLTDYKFSEIEVKNISLVVDELETTLYKKWEKLKELQSVNELDNFAKYLIKLGNKHENGLIVKYGLEIEKALNHFEIGKIQLLLAEYPLLIKHCRKEL